MIMSTKAAVIKIYNAKGSLVRLNTKIVAFAFWKALAYVCMYYNADVVHSCKFRSQSYDREL
jgi:hypothetical protein